MRTLKTGDPCPCCGQPIHLTDPGALRLLALTSDLLGLPDHPAVPEAEDIPSVLSHRYEGCPYGSWQTMEDKP